MLRIKPTQHINCILYMHSDCIVLERRMGTECMFSKASLLPSNVDALCYVVCLSAEFTIRNNVKHNDDFGVILRGDIVCEEG